MLRGSSLTGWRWDHKQPFDGGGPGTSDLDLTLVGDGPLAFFKATGFFVPGVHSRPLSDEDPDIAPDLVPLRQRLMAMVQRPVNIQASREIVIQVRGDLIGQPYLELFRKPEGLSLNGTAATRDVPPDDLQHPSRRPRPRGGDCRRDQRLRARSGAPAGGHRSARASSGLAEDTGMEEWRAYAGQSLGFLSRRPRGVCRVDAAARVAARLHRSGAGRRRASACSACT